MGAKTQANAKEKRPTLTCEDCKREFLTMSALKSHTMAKHPEKYKQMQKSEPENKEVKKTAFVPPTARVSKRLQLKKSSDEAVIDGKSDMKQVESDSITEAQSKPKTMFECPKCLQVFSAYFSANKHIQKRHCEDKDGNAVPPDSPNLIKPIPKEMYVDGDKLKYCKKSKDADAKSLDNGTYCCLGCKQTFLNIASFDEHVEAVHNDKVNVFILENMDEFLTWKTDIEAKQRVKYLTLSNTTQKQYYQCNYVSPQNSASLTHLCPSVMIVREFSKGVHLRHFKEHHEHTCENLYQLNENTKTVLDHNEVFNEVMKSGEDAYNKLKNIMNTIVQKAALLKRSQLKPLYISALEMQAYLNSLNSVTDELTPLKTSNPNNIQKTDNDSLQADDNKDQSVEKPIQKSMSDDQITQALETPRISTRLKRKSDCLSGPGQKKKLDKAVTQKTGLKENNSQNKDTPSERFESPKPNILSPVTQSPPSFNDTYKQFIVESSPIIEKTETSTTKKAKKEIVKTKMGQFSPKKLEKIDTQNVETKKKRREPARSNVSLENLNLEDVEYEVVEQENDCNILILKI